MTTPFSVRYPFHFPPAKNGVRFSLEHAWGATDYLDEIAESGCDICYGPIAIDLKINYV